MNQKEALEKALATITNMRSIMNRLTSSNRKATLTGMQKLLDGTTVDFEEIACEPTIQELQDQLHATARAKGWHETERSFGEYIALFHSELSEAWEEYRNHRALDEIYSSKDGKPEGIPVELADCIIRILDFCGRYEIPMGEIIANKAAFNGGRPYRHGGKAA